MTKNLESLQEANIIMRGPKKACRGLLDDGVHSHYDHTPAWAYENPAVHQPFHKESHSLLDELPAGATLQEILGHTRLIVFLGASPNAVLLRALAREDLIVVIMEPCEEVLEEALSHLPQDLTRRNGVIYITGDPEGHVPPVQEVLPDALFQAGIPAFLATDRIRTTHAAWAHKATEYLELLYYRHRVYPVSGQQFNRSRPIRNIRRGMIFDQHLHSYENLTEYMRWPAITDLKDTFTGATAILVAAGPELPEKLEFLRDNADNALIICVNNALKPLLDNGIEPHFVIINDTSIASGQVFRQIRPTSRTILVGHCLSDLGGNKFKRKFIFGNFKPELFGNRPMLRLHGSVISTAFSLARHLGCGRCIFVGTQLASSNPWQLSYSKGTVHGEAAERNRERIDRFPQLYPVTCPDGTTLFTSLNFRDAALWLSEEIRISGIPCINTSTRSILFGEGIRQETDPELPPDPGLKTRLAALNRIRHTPPAADKVTSFLNTELAFWKQLKKALTVLQDKQEEQLAASFGPLLDQLDNGGITHLVERYEDFSNARFIALLESEDAAERDRGRRYFLAYASGMADRFIDELARRAAELERLLSR